MFGGFLPIFGGRFVERACNDTLEMEVELCGLSFFGVAGRGFFPC